MATSKIVSAFLSKVLSAQSTNDEPVSSYRNTDWCTVHKVFGEPSKGNFTKIAILDYKINFSNLCFNNLSGHEEINCILTIPDPNSDYHETDHNVLEHGTLMATLLAGSDVDLTDPPTDKKYTGPIPNTHIVNMIIGDEKTEVDLSAVSNALFRVLTYNEANKKAKIDVVLIPYVENPIKPSKIKSNVCTHIDKLKEKDLIGYTHLYKEYNYIRHVSSLLESTGVTIICAAGNYYSFENFGFTPPACFSSNFTIGAAFYNKDKVLMLHEKSNRSQKTHKIDEYPYFVSTLAPLVKNEIESLLSEDQNLKHLTTTTSVSSAMFAGFFGSYKSYCNNSRLNFSNQELRNLLNKAPNKTNPGRYKVVNILNFFNIKK